MIHGTRRRTGGGGSGDDDTSYWISFSDLATALLLAFLLIIVSMLMQHRQQEAAAKQRLEALVGVRESLIDRLRQEFVKESQEVRVDERTGALELPARILFAYNRADLTPEGRAYLTGFFRKYVDVLLSPSFRPYVAQIDIEGHADQDGGYLTNMQLTQARSFAVCSFLFDPAQSRISAGKLAALRPLVSVNGRSNTDPVYAAAAGSPGVPRRVDAARSRRVTFKFRLKDEQLIQDLKRLLQE